MILVTGASGHIGNVLVRTLVSQNKKVRIVTSTGKIPECLKEFPLEVFKADIREANAVEKAMEGVEIVYHLASVISISSFDAPELFEVNVQGTQNILDACLKQGVKRLVYTSSTNALPNRPHNEMITEESDFNVDNLAGAYSRSKAQATRRVLEAVEKGLDAVICFPSAVIGPHDYRGSEVRKMIQDYAKNKLKAYVSGEYNFVDVRDVVQGILAAGEKGRKGEGYMLAGYKMNLIDFLKMLQANLPNTQLPLFKIPVPLAISAAWLLEIICKPFNIKPIFTAHGIKILQSNANFSIEKSQKELGYAPRSIEICLKDTLLWLKEMGKI